jgi:single-strand DNA-binding protein
MAEETMITIVGNAVENAELRFTPSGAAVAKFRIASTPRTYDKAAQAFKDGEPLFMQVVCWRQMAESVAETVTKGMRLIVHGTLKPNNYETREGEKRYGFEIEASDVGPSLKFATAKVAKAARSDSGGGRGNNGGRQQGAPDDPWAGATPANASRDGGSNFDESPPF